MDMPQWMIDAGYSILDWIEGWIDVVDLGSEA